MTGLPEFNYPAFFEAEEIWDEAGWNVVNPARNHDGDTTLPRESYLRLAYQQVCQASAVAFLPGWECSEGATREHQIATDLGLPLYDAMTRKPLVRESILDEASRIVNGSRNLDYGAPHINHARTARLVNAYFGTSFTSLDVCVFNVMQKLARSQHDMKRDTWVDIAGYADNAWKCVTAAEVEGL